MPSGGKGLVHETGLQHTRGAWKEKADEELSTQVSLLPEAKRGRIFTLLYTKEKLPHKFCTNCQSCEIYQLLGS